MKKLTLLLLVLCPGAARAGGILLDRAGNLVPQYEQEAHIQFYDGLEVIYLGILSERTRGPSLFIMPVPGPPGDANAAGVDI
ncbi:MAG: hypothetical protein AB7K24_23855, partial [Gemmataceae bacterium]